MQTLHILTVDCCNGNALPIKKGVGMARKIGSDIACLSISKNMISTPVIFSSDADAYIPNNYFDFNLRKKTSAWTFSFRHIGGEPLLKKATALYEHQLRQLRKGLKESGSPYAFSTLGSCLAISADHYAMVRGFPKRAAAEDFYLLNKLAKVGYVETLEHICIRIDARESSRVPFGTGPAVSKIMTKIRENKEVYYYNPIIFSKLQEVICAIENIKNHVNEGQTSINNAPQHYQPLVLSDLSTPAWAALSYLRFECFQEKRFAEDKTAAAFVKSFHAWFDAFRTLKFIHFLRDHYYPNIVMKEYLRL